MILDRRRLLLNLAGAAGALWSAGARAKVGKVAIGAIRWDAWFEPAAHDEVRRIVAKTLSPQKWRGRAPECAAVGADGEMSYSRCDTQAEIDAEIRLASGAGLDFWAYCWYGEKDPLQEAWRLHQSSALADRMKWSFILVGLARPEQRAAQIADFARLSGRRNYQTVLDGRPLLFLRDAGVGREIITQVVRDIRDRAKAAGANPYIVVMDPGDYRDETKATGADAVGFYAKGGPTPYGADYGKLAAMVEAFWRQLAATRQQVVPTAMTGWDTRPRQETPVPWPTNHKGPQGQEPFFKRGTPQAIAAHIKAMIGWIAANPSVCPAQVGLIYSWDEYDEGGSTLAPTLQGDDRILDGVARVLKN